MPPLIPDAPWWANAALVILGLLAVGVIPALLTYRSTRDKLSSLAEDTAVVKEQVKNTHDTNLRHDVDDLKAGLASVIRGQEDTGRYVADIDKSLRAIGHSLDRRDRLQTQALAEAVEDRKRETADAIESAVQAHVLDCPLRNPKEG